MEFLFWHEIGHYVYYGKLEAYMAIDYENHMRNIMGYHTRNYDEIHSLKNYNYYIQELIKHTPK
jgi:hypothetical protein